MTHSNLESFFGGYSQHNPSYADRLQKQRWLDDLLYTSLSEIEDVYEEDALALVKTIMDRGDSGFRQLYVISLSKSLFSA